jgi:hypothetical protein
VNFQRPIDSFKKATDSTGGDAQAGASLALTYQQTVPEEEEASGSRPLGIAPD